MLKKYFQMNTWVILGVIVVFELILNLLLKSTLLSEKVLYNSLVEQMTLEDINTFSTAIRSNAWLMVVFSVVQRVVEIGLIAVCISIGTLLFRFNINFKQIFGVVVNSFLVFTLSRFPFIFFMLSGKIEKFEDLTYIPMYSIAEWMGPDAIAEWALYPLQVLNIYQLVFILLMAAGLNLTDFRGYPKWLILVLGTYGTAMVITMIITSFVTGV